VYNSGCTKMSEYRKRMQAEDDSKKTTLKRKEGLGKRGGAGLVVLYVSCHKSTSRKVARTFKKSSYASIHRLLRKSSC